MTELRKQKSCPAQMTVRRAGETIMRGPAHIATGSCWVEMLLESEVEGENTAMQALLDPGVISHWHSHPRGQFLYVLSGVGLAQRHGGPIEELRAGDRVWFAPGEHHWHGASPTSTFAYISIQAVHEGAFVHWLGPVVPEGQSERLDAV